VVHAIAFSDKAELAADFRFRDTSLANFNRSLMISCWSFIDVARRASAMMPGAGRS
jgi:enoyl-[acyl-carrier protein] reductase I